MFIHSFFPKKLIISDNYVGVNLALNLIFKIMKTFTMFLTVVFLMVFSQNNHAQSVTREMAVQVAKNHFASQSTLKSSRVKPVEFQRFIAETTGPDTICFILSDTVTGSFIIVAADERIYPVLAYSDEGAFPDLANAAPGFLAMLQSQLDEAAYLIHNQVPPTVEVVNSWSYLKSGAMEADVSSVDPLLETAWDQGCYYNSACPYDAYSAFCQRPPTGCTATAMTQIMAFWKYPVNGKGAHSYNSRYGWLSANFGNTTYNWSKMPNQLTSENSEVAKLMFHVGVAVDMDYNTKGSAAWKPSAFSEFFDYSGDLKEVYRDYEANFTDLLKAELEAGRPVLYAGYNESNGHAFVLDGYSGSKYHFNWGWSGTPDTWFYLGSLNPNGMNFNSNQIAVIGIQPSIQKDGVDLIIAGGTKNVSPETVTAGEKITAECAVDNLGNKSAGSSYVTIWISEDKVLRTNEDVNLGKISFSTIAGKSCSIVKSNDFTIPESTPAGDYYIFFWADGTQKIEETVEDNNFVYVKITVEGEEEPSVNNDECKNAEELTINKEMDGTLKGATKSLSENQCGTTKSTVIVDVWYKFKATSETHTIEAYPGSGLDIVVEVRDGCPGSNLACRDAGGGKGKKEVLTLNNLDVGETYYVRIHQDGSKTSDDFRIIVTGESIEKPDLIVSKATVSPDENLVPSQSVTFTIEIENKNGSAVPETYTRVFVSNDNNLDIGEDYSFASIGIAGTDYTTSLRTITILLPEKEFDGDYYLIFEADSYYEVDETNENNNTYAVSVTYKSQSEECTYEVSISKTDFEFDGGTGKVEINTGDDCAWEVETGCDFIEFISDNEGSGSDVVKFEVIENPTSKTLEGDITIMGDNFEKVFTVFLEPNPECIPTPDISTIEVPAEGGKFSFKVKNCPDGFWNIYNSCSSMVKNISPKEGTGTQTVSFEVLPNDSDQPRNCKMTVQESNKSVRINQAGKQSTVLSAPVLAQAANINESGFSTSWNAVEGATGYIVELAFDNSFNNLVSGYSQKNVGNKTEYTFSNLESGKNYFLRVSSYHSTQTSAWSNVINVKTSATKTDVTLSIGDVSGAKGSTITVPVKALNLTNCSAFQGTIEFDAGKLQYLGIESLAVDKNEVTINAQFDRLCFVYADDAFSINNGLFFNLKFKVLAGSGSTNVKWSDSPTVREFSDANAKGIIANYKNGLVTVKDGMVLSGSLKYGNAQNTPLADATVTLSGQKGNYSCFSENDGLFNISLAETGDYYISSELRKDWFGPTAMDLTIMKKFIAGLESLNTLQQVAADVNGDSKVTASDVTLLKQRILGQISGFNIPDFINNPSSINFTGSINVDVTGLFAGDVNGSWSPSETKSGNVSGLVATQEKVQRSGNIFIVPFSMTKNVSNITSVTLKVAIPQGFTCKTISDFPNQSDLSYNVNKANEMILVYSSLTPFSLASGKTLFTLKLEYKNQVLPDKFDISAAEIEFGNSNNQVIDVSLNYPSVLNISTGIDEEIGTAIGVYPNPATDFITVTNLPSDAKIELADSYGRVVFQKFTAESTCKIDVSKVITGFYYVRISTDAQNVVTKKIVITD